MPTRIERDEVRRLIVEEQGQLVEVLPHDEFERAHIAGAISMTLQEIDAGATSVFDRRRPVIVYCNDYL